MKLAYVILQGHGRTDALIAEVAGLLATDGERLAGTVCRTSSGQTVGNATWTLSCCPMAPSSASAKIAVIRPGAAHWIPVR